MGIASQLKKNKMVGGERNHFKEGRHRCRVSSVMMGRTQMTDADIFAIEMIVVKTDSDDKSMQPGCQVNSAFLRSGNQAKVYFGNIKAFIAGLYGFTEQDIDEMPDEDLDLILENLTGRAQAATGLLVDVVCIPRQDGKIFPQWKHVPDDQQPIRQAPATDAAGEAQASA